MWLVILCTPPPPQHSATYLSHAKGSVSPGPWNLMQNRIYEAKIFWFVITLINEFGYTVTMLATLHVTCV
jgi:hypothetical protein